MTLSSPLSCANLVYQIVEAKLQKSFPQTCPLNFYPAVSPKAPNLNPSLEIAQPSATSYALSRTALDLAAAKVDPAFAQDQHLAPNAHPTATSSSSPTPLRFTQRTQLTPDYRLQYFPHLLVSLSHTKNYGAAVVKQLLPHPPSQTSPLTQAKPRQGIGIDLEIASRIVRPEITTHISNHRDNLQSLKTNPLFSNTIPPLSLITWCLKEAAFKALAAQNPQVKFLSEIWLDYPHFGYAPLEDNEEDAEKERNETENKNEIKKFKELTKNKNQQPDQNQTIPKNNSLSTARGTCQVQIITNLAEPLVLALAAVEF